MPGSNPGLGDAGWHEQILVRDQFAHIPDRLDGFLLAGHRFKAVP